jgi:hypothetical protein
MAKKRVAADAVLAAKLIEGTAKHLAGVGQLMLAGGTLTPAQATTELQAIVNAHADVDAALATVKAKRAAVRAQAPTHRVFLDAFVAFVRAAFGATPDVMADFGVKPRKAATPLTVDAKAAAAAKREATRAARHVMGPKQRKAVKGDVTGVTVTPIVAPTPVAAVPAGTTRPAPVAGGAAGPAPHTA